MKPKNPIGKGRNTKKEKKEKKEKKQKKEEREEEKNDKKDKENTESKKEEKRKKESEETIKKKKKLDEPAERPKYNRRDVLALSEFDGRNEHYVFVRVKAFTSTGAPRVSIVPTLIYDEQGDSISSSKKVRPILDMDDTDTETEILRWYPSRGYYMLPSMHTGFSGGYSTIELYDPNEEYVDKYLSA